MGRPTVCWAPWRNGRTYFSKRSSEKLSKLRSFSLDMALYSLREKSQLSRDIRLTVFPVSLSLGTVSSACPQTPNCYMACCRTAWGCRPRIAGTMNRAAFLLYAGRDTRGTELRHCAHGKVVKLLSELDTGNGFDQYYQR